MLTISELARNVGYSRQYVQRCVKDGCPLDDFESARLWFQANRPYPKKELKPLVEEVFKRNGELTGSTEISKALESSAVAAAGAWKMLEEALIEGKPSKIVVYLNIHTKAVEALVKTERMVREEMERRKVLVTVNESQTLFRRLVEIVVSRLGAMPQNIAARVNPSAPEHALEILQQECAAIIADAQKVMSS